MAYIVKANATALRRPLLLLIFHVSHIVKTLHIFNIHINIVLFIRKYEIKLSSLILDSRNVRELISIFTDKHN